MLTARPASPERLNLGCGHDIRGGWVNLDRASLPGVDVVCDLDRDLPLPFEDERFDEILCQDVLEHVDIVPVLGELHRVLCAGGALLVRVPHFTSRNYYLDPTHRTAFSIDTLLFFVRESPIDRNYYFQFAFSYLRQRRITFQRSKWQPWNGFVEAVVNRTWGTQRFYESTFLSRLFPAMNVECSLVK